MTSLIEKSVAISLLKRGADLTPEAIRAAGFPSIEAIAQCVADQLKIPRIALDEVEMVPSFATVIPRAMAERHRVVPVFVSKEEITVATADPSRIELFDWLAHELRRPVVAVVSSPLEITRALKRLYEPLETAPTTRSLRMCRPKKRSRRCPSSTSSSCVVSRPAPATSTSRPARKSPAFAIASTACSRWHSGFRPNGMRQLSGASR